jgi:hypothetical protein
MMSPLSFNPVFGGVIPPQILTADVLAQLVAAAGAGTATVPEPSRLPTVSVQDAFARIPVAEAGHVIGPDFHNSVRDFCRVVALAVGGAVDRGLTVDVPLALLPTNSGTAAGWESGLGQVINAQGSADGWVNADLPHGATITGVTVTGRRTGTKPGTVTVLLHRVKRSDPDDRVTLVTVRLGAFPDGPFETPLTPLKPNVPQITPEQIPAYATVDRFAFRYLIQAIAAASPEANSTALYSIQVACDRF